MSSNKNLLLALIFLILVLLGCNGNKEKNIPQFNYDNPDQILQIVKEHFDQDIAKVLVGRFDQQNEISVAAFAQKDDSISWGIKFYQLYQKDGKIICNFETDILEGTIGEIVVEKIKSKDKPFEMLYYNTSDYFMGSAGGEIFSYIIDFNDKQIYYAHFVHSFDNPNSLFISENTDINIRNFFISKFRKEFPQLKIVDNDITID